MPVVKDAGVRVVCSSLFLREAESSVNLWVWVAVMTFSPINLTFVTSSVRGGYFAWPSIPHDFELFWFVLVFFEKVLFAAAFDTDATFAVFAAFFTAAVATADAVVGDPPASGMLQLYAAAPQTSRFPI